MVVKERQLRADTPYKSQLCNPATPEREWFEEDFLLTATGPVTTVQQIGKSNTCFVLLS